LYESFDVTVFAVSNETGDGIRNLSTKISEGVTAVVGNSGVGKSSLLNNLIPGIDLHVREVSEWSGKGTHTTTAAVMVKASEKSALIDTPGMKSFVPYGITQENLVELFPDIQELAAHCKFRDCRHVAEPECAVRAAIEKNKLAESRLQSYCRLLSEIPSF
jgi:ribosome biogenesis GTPase